LSNFDDEIGYASSNSDYYMIFHDTYPIAPENTDPCLRVWSNPCESPLNFYFYYLDSGLLFHFFYALADTRLNFFNMAYVPLVVIIRNFINIFISFIFIMNYEL